MPRGILFCVRRRARHTYVVRLPTSLIVQDEDNTVEDVLMLRTRLMSLEMNSKNSDLIVL